MALDEGGQAGAIAAEWGVSVDLLEEADWDIETIDGNDGELYGYFVRFHEDTDPDVLAQLGVAPGELYREVSINAFDEPDDEEEYERYRAQYGDDRRRIAERDPVERSNIMSDFARGDGDNAAVIGNGATFAGSSFAGNSFAVSDDGISSVDEPLPDIGDGDDDEFELAEPSERPGIQDRQYDLDGQQITAADFRDLHPARRIEVMLQWFHDNYEDPAVRTPYESAEGGYQWIWGGPYDAREQIGDEFSDIADEDEIEAAVDEVEKDGLVDWAPKERPGDYDVPDDEVFTPPPESLAGIAASNFQNGNFSNFAFAGKNGATSTAGDIFTTDRGEGIVDENGNRLIVGSMPAADPGAAYQRELTTRIEKLEAALENYSQHLPPRNHNHPPELVEPDPIAPVDLKLVVEVVVELKADVQEARPDPIKLEAKASLLRRVAGAIAAWCGRKMDAAVDAGIQWAIPVGIAWGLANPQQVQAALNAVAETASTWAKYLLALT